MDLFNNLIYWKRVFHCTGSLVSCYFRRNAFFFIYSPITFLTYQFTFLICYSFSSKDYLIGARFDGNGYIQYAMGNFSLLTDFQIKIRLRTFQTNTSIFIVQRNTSVSRGFCHPNRKSEKKNGPFVSHIFQKISRPEKCSTRNSMKWLSRAIVAIFFTFCLLLEQLHSQDHYCEGN